MLKVIAETTWSWMLFEHEGEYLLSVLCGSVAMYGREIQLDATERADYLEHGQDSIEKLARAIRNNPNAYQSRQIKDFHQRDDISQAAKAWRLKHNPKND